MEKTNLRLGALVSYIWVIVHLIVNMLLVPILVRTMGDSEYGLYQVVASFLAYISVLETSVSSSVLKFFCQENNFKNKDKINNLLAICRKIYRFLSIISLAIGIIVILGFRSFYQSSFTVYEINEGTWMLALLFINLAVTMLNAIYVAAINGNERFVFLKLLSIASQVLQPLICIVILKYYPYALTVIIIQVCLNVFVAATRYFYAKHKLDIKPKLDYFDKVLCKNIFFFALSMLLANVADQIFLKTDQVILGKLYNTSTVAVYSVGSQIYTNYMYVGITVASVFFPRVSKYFHERNGIYSISNLFIKVGRIAFFACFLVLSGFVILGKEFIYLWVGSNYTPAYEIALAVMIPFTIDIIQHLGLTILQVCDCYGFRAKMYFVAACLNIISTILLASVLGGFGAALSTGFSMLITSGFILNYYYKNKIGLNIFLFWKNILTILIKMLPFLIIAYILNKIFIFEYSWTHFLVFGASYSILYCLIAYLIAMNDYEKKLIISFKNKLLRRKIA